jgi:hypothetical protein
MQEEGCPTYPTLCNPFSAEQAEYNVLQVFFLNTPGANRFGGPTTLNYMPPSQPTPRYLEVMQQDITYAEQSTSVAQPIMDVMTGQTYQMSAQDMLNMAKASLFGRLSAHDFSNDGRSDILWRDNAGNMAIWEMNGGAIFNENTAGLGNVPTAWSIVGTGDFNGDGNADILWRNTTTGDLAIWEMNGTTILNANTAGLGNVPLNWSIVGVGDFNGDGMADILWRNNTNGNVAIWLMNGTTVTNSSTATFGNMPATWSVAGTGDFNGDGLSDILWRDTAGDIAIWEMNGTTILNPSTSGVGNLSTVWSVAETGDFDGNGMSDILWRDSSGDIAIWFMNGTAIASSAGLGTIPTTFTIQGTNAD